MAYDGSTMVATAPELGPSLHALAYGPKSEGATAADMRQVHGKWVQNLGWGDIALSPNQYANYPPRSTVNVVDPSGKIVYRNFRIADESWISQAAGPTHDTFEIYNGPSLGRGYHLQLVSRGDTGAEPSGQERQPSKEEVASRGAPAEPKLPSLSAAYQQREQGAEPEEAAEPVTAATEEETPLQKLEQEEQAEEAQQQQEEEPLTSQEEVDRLNSGETFYWADGNPYMRV